MSLRIVASVGILILLSVAACDNGCEDALDQTSDVSANICTEPAYGKTPFCSICVKNGYLSTTGATDCECTLLSYDQPVCTYPSKKDATSAIRAAIDWANESCKTFTFGSAGQGGQAGGGN